MGDDFQERVLLGFTALRSLRHDWGGALILCCGLGPEGAALAMAANIAGALFVGIEEDLAAVRASGSLGACDFLVNTLDEALRTLKNEARKRQPISIGLQGSLPAALEEIVERGVQPEIVVGSEDRWLKSAPVAALVHRGAMRISQTQIAERAQGFARERAWALHTFAASDAMVLRAFDRKALEVLAKDPLRTQWIRGASRIVQRQRPLKRLLWVTAEEERVLEAQDYSTTESS